LGVPNAVVLIEVFDKTGAFEYVQVLLNSRGTAVVSPHNLLLTTGVSFGPFAALALGVLYWVALRDGKIALKISYHQGDLLNAFWVLLFLVANVAIITHSWFHNASIAMGEMRNWLWFGLLIYYSKEAD
jgi:hypothetical protein